MNADWDALLGALDRCLRHEVAPHLDNEQARIQLNAAIYVLANLRLQGGWSAALVRRHVQAQLEFFEALRQSWPDSGQVLPAASDPPRDIEQARLDGDAAINRVVDWLDGVAPAQRDGRYDAAQAALAAYLRRAVTIDRGATAKSMMLELSGPGSQRLD
jgi:hypothetical protein